MTMTNPRPPKARPELTVDIVVFTVKGDKLVVLLTKRTEEPFAEKFALPGGYVWQGETTKQAVERILDTKVGDADVFFEQLYTFDNPDRDPRGPVVSVAYFALMPETILREDMRPNVVVEPVDSLRDLAFDHREILIKATQRLRNKLLYSNVAYSLLPDFFTLTQLQEVYEAIIGSSFDKRNFRKKILSLDLLRTTDKKTVRSSHRPASLYAFKKHRYAELDDPAF